MLQIRIFVCSMLLITSSIAAAESPLLDGRWVQECKADSYTSSHQTTLEIKDGKMKQTEIHSMFSSCGTKAVKVENETTLVLGDKISHPEGASKLDVIYESVHLTPIAQMVVDRWNRQKFCGHLNWKLGERVEVTGLTCDKDVIPAKGERHYSIVSVIEGALLLGQDTKKRNGRSEALRHDQFDPKEFKKTSLTDSSTSDEDQN